MLIVSIDDKDDAERAYAAIAGELSAGSVNLSSGSRGFDGLITNDIVILAAIVSPIAVKRIADILISLIAAKSDRQVTVNGVSLKGYSVDDAARLIAASASATDGKPG